MNTGQTSNIISDFWENLIVQFPERVSILLIALIVVSVFGFLYGGLKKKALPLFWVILDSVLSSFVEKAFRQSRSDSALSFRGAGFTVFVLFISIFISFSGELLVDAYPFYGASSVIIVALALSSGAHWRMMLDLYKALKNPTDKKGGTAYFTVAASSRIDLNAMDESGMIRTASNFSLLSFERMILLPSLGYLLGGFIGLFFVSGLGYVVWRIGREGAGRGADSIAFSLLRILSFLSLPLLALIFILSTLFVPSSHVGRAIKALFFSPLYFIYLNIVARAMNIVLGGPAKDIDLWVIKRPWIGGKTVPAQMNIEKIKYMSYFLVVATILWIGILFASLWGYKALFL